jgi:hypothetical protein
MIKVSEFCEQTYESEAEQSLANLIVATLNYKIMILISWESQCLLEQS